MYISFLSRGGVVLAFEEVKAVESEVVSSYVTVRLDTGDVDSDGNTIYMTRNIQIFENAEDVEAYNLAMALFSLSTYYVDRIERTVKSWLIESF